MPLQYCVQNPEGEKKIASSRTNWQAQQDFKDTKVPVQESDDAGLGVMVGIFSSILKSQEDLEGFEKTILV